MPLFEKTLYFLLMLISYIALTNRIKEHHEYKEESADTNLHFFKEE